MAKACSNNKNKRGKILSNKTPKGSNGLKTAFRDAAYAISNLKDTHFLDFLKEYLAAEEGQQP